jgi:hypothetical protein
MKQQHHPTDLKSFEKGINSDANDELMANRPGEHVDANNMRSSAMDGDNYAKKKIKGEEVVFPNVDNRCTVGTGQPLDDGYECMMTQEVNGHIVEIWAHNSNNLEVYPSLIRIDGLIVAMSENFNVRSDFPLEYDKNESCIGGEFFITDNRVTPMVFNVKDLLINSGVDVGDEEGECTQKYFDGFDEDLYQVGITSELFQMAFIRQATSTSNGTFDVVFGTEGLPVGMYSYTYRYVTGEGDRSGWAPLSVQIPVLRGRNAIPNEQYMYNAGNYGDFAAPQSPTTYGNYLRLKYDNKSKFEFIEVRRDTWIVGATLNTPPVSELIGSFPISEGLNVVRILDYASAAQAEEDLVEEDLVDVPTVIQRAKAIRYYNNKLWLMNVGYREKDIGETVTIESPDDAIKPTVQKLFKRGHIDPYAAAYYKSNMRGEAYGIGLTFRDDSGGTTFVVPVEESYQFPNRRDVVDSESFGHSYYSVVRAANVNGTVGRTYEVFDHANAKKRAEFPEEVRQHRWGPFEGGTIPSYAVLFDFQFGNTAVNGYGEPQRATLVNILEDQNVNNPALLGLPLDAFVDPFKVLHPTSQTDPESQYNRRINTHVYYDNGYSEQSVNYNPQAFAIDYYSLGAAFKGIDVSTLPDWVDGFSLVTTEPARRVVAQGLGFYDLKSGSTGTFAGLEENATKSGDALLCNFPDLDDGYGLYDATEYIRPHGPTSQYRIDLVAPLGFFSEFYSYYSPENSGGPPATIGVVLTMYKAGQRWAIDAISHCRVLYDNGQINPGWEGPGGSLGNYVGFGSWRQLSQNQSTFPANVKAPPLVIDQITQVVEPSGLAKNLRVQTFAGVYSQAGTGGGPENQQYFFSGLKKWQEPVYVVNLVREGAAVNVGTINAYNHTGHYQKLKSKILESDGSNGQTAILVSERWEDCIVDKSNTYEGVMVSNAYSDLERFVTVEDSNGSNLWVNVTEKTAAEINSITNDIATNGFAVVTDPSGSYNVYGIYTDSKTIEGTAVIYNLHFDNLEPLANVYVQYDKRIPIRYFGGDTYVNDHIWAPLDKRYRGDKGEPQDDIDEFVLNIPFPLSMYQLNATIGLVGNSNTNVSSRYLTNTVVETPSGGEIMYRGSNMVPGHIYFDATLFGSGNPDWGFEGFLPSRWRQLVTTWVAETRVNLSYAFNLELPTLLPEASLRMLTFTKITLMNMVMSILHGV